MKFPSIIAIALLLAMPQISTAQTSGISPQNHKTTEANWFIPLNYAGLDFEIPAGSLVEKNAKVIVKYPDGTFGVSMENENISLSQKLAYEKVKMYAKRYNMTDTKCSKATVGGLDGAKATGKIDGMEVTILILPVKDQQVTAVLMATPERKEWAEHFIDTLKH